MTKFAIFKHGISEEEVVKYMENRAMAVCGRRGCSGIINNEANYSTTEFSGLADNVIEEVLYHFASDEIKETNFSFSIVALDKYNYPNLQIGEDSLCLLTPSYYGYLSDRSLNYISVAIQMPSMVISGGEFQEYRWLFIARILAKIVTSGVTVYKSVADEQALLQGVLLEKSASVLSTWKHLSNSFDISEEEHQKEIKRTFLRGLSDKLLLTLRNGGSPISVVYGREGLSTRAIPVLKSLCQNNLLSRVVEVKTTPKLIKNVCLALDFSEESAQEVFNNLLIPFKGVALAKAMVQRQIGTSSNSEAAIQATVLSQEYAFVLQNSSCKVYFINDYLSILEMAANSSSVKLRHRFKGIQDMSTIQTRSSLITAEEMDVQLFQTFREAEKMVIDEIKADIKRFDELLQEEDGSHQSYSFHV